MVDLVQRITGDLVDRSQKIALHPFLASLNELKRGKVAQSDIVEAFSLDASQTAQMSTLISLFTASTEKTEFMRVFKDLMYMGESNLHSRYRDITFIQTRLQEEVTDNGGVLL